MSKVDRGLSEGDQDLIGSVQHGDLVEGLSGLDFASFSVDFSGSAETALDNPDLPDLIRRLLEFGVSYHRSGLDRTVDTSLLNLPVEVIDFPAVRSHSGEQALDVGPRSSVKPGRLLGIIGVGDRFTTLQPRIVAFDGRRQEKIFIGVARMVNGISGRDEVIPVGILPNGSMLRGHASDLSPSSGGAYPPRRRL